MTDPDDIFFCGGLYRHNRQTRFDYVKDARSELPLITGHRPDADELVKMAWEFASLYRINLRENPTNAHLVQASTSVAFQSPMVLVVPPCFVALVRQLRQTGTFFTEDMYRFVHPVTRGISS